MSGESGPRLTLEERLALAAQSKASSPEAAAAMVRRFSNFLPGYIFCGKEDLDIMSRQIGDSWDDSRVGLDTYHSFILSFQLAIMKNDDPSKAQDPYRPIYGPNVNNALVLLGEMLLDQAIGRWWHKDIYHCLHLTLWQYLETMSRPDFRHSVAGIKEFLIWRDRLLLECDGSQPLAQAIAGILRRYMSAWEVFGRLDNTLRCLGGLALNAEREGTVYELNEDHELVTDLLPYASNASALRRAIQSFGGGYENDRLPVADSGCGSPPEYFKKLAQGFAPKLPDPGGDMEERTLRSQIFLRCRTYSPDALREIAGKNTFEEFKPLLDEYLATEDLASRMEELNHAVRDIYMLFVEPYIGMK